MSYTYITNLSDLKAASAVLKDYKGQQKNTKLALDLEGYSTVEGKFPRSILWEGDYLGKITTMQLGCDPEVYDHQYIIDVRKLGEEAVGEYTREIIEGCTILGQNLKFDVAFLLTQFNINPKILRDVMLISQILTAGDRFPHSLSNLYRKYLDYSWFKAETGMSFDEYEKFKKEMQVSDWTQELTLTQLQYTADDVKLIFPLYRAILNELDKFVGIHGRKGIYEVIKLECSLIKEFALMELRGVDVDKEYHTTSVIKYLTREKERNEEIAGRIFTVPKWVGRGKLKTLQQEPANLRSPKQVIESLAKVGVVVENSQEVTLKKALVEHKDNPQLYMGIRAILDARKASSLLSKFGQKMLDLVYPDGRLHPNMHQIGSELAGITTGRSSSSEPNIMQIPMNTDVLKVDGKMVKGGEVFRPAFKAPDNYKLIVTDMSNIEPRVTAQVTRDPMLISELKKENMDLHALTAQFLLDLPEPPVKGTDEREVIGKTANLAMAYGIGPSKLARFMLDKTIDKDVVVRWKVNEAKEYINRYYSAFEGLKQEMLAVEQKLRKAVEPFPSLLHFKNRKPIFVEFTLMGRPRRWCLTQEQEWMCKKNPEKLHRDYKEKVRVQVLDEYGDPVLDKEGNPLYTWKESNWNEYRKTMNRIAREAYNFRVQGSSADLFKCGILEISLNTEKLLENLLSEGILMVVHDEVVFRSRQEKAQEFQEIICKSMISAGERFVKVVPIKVSSKIGQTWAEAK